MINNNPLISVITPTYNSQDHLAECLDSLFNQKFKSFEHIVIDSLSSDKTLQIIKNKKKTKIINKKSNIYEAYNIAIEKSNGKYIFILNSDDKLDQDAFSNFYEEYKKNKDIDLFSSIGVEFQDNINNILRIRKFTEAKLFQKGIIKFKSQSILGCYIKKDIYKKLNYFNTTLSISSDKDFLIKMALMNLKVFNINHNSYFIRSHGKSMTFGNSSKEKLLEAIRQNFIITNLYSKNVKIPLGVKYFCCLILIYRNIQDIKINFKVGIIKKIIKIFKLVPIFFLLSIYFIRIKVYEKLI